MRYDLDLEKLSLHEYLALLKRQNLLPSRQMLREDIEGKFARIRAQGAASVAQLLKALSSSVKVEAFAAQSGVAADYLAMLRREAGTLKHKPAPLSAFPDTDKAEVETLAKRGIKTSKAYFESREPGGRLYALCDLLRINGVGPNAAAMFYAAGYHSAADIANADAATLLASVAAVNENHRYYAGALGEKDMQFCVEFAKVLEAFC